MKKRLKGNIDYRAVLALFVAGSVAGFIFEGIYAIIKRGAWENHSATVWGPFCVVYGIGAVAIYLVSLLLYNKSMVEQFLMFAAAGSTVEYFCSWLQETVFGSASWNYTGRFLNIRGRVCLEMTMIWGVLGLGFARLVFPYAVKLLSFARMHISSFAVIAITIFMAANLIVSAAAVLRWRDRRNGVPPRNKIESYLDSRYGEEVMEKVYGNMVFADEEAA